MIPVYDLDKIRFATDKATFEKAVALYEEGKVREFKEEFGGYSAVVMGSRPYNVSVSARRHDEGDCECYLGQNNTLCKHMIAVAIMAIKKGGKLEKEERNVLNIPLSSGRAGELSKAEMEKVKKKISEAVKLIKAYSGPSRIWFAYQNSLSEGCNRLSAIVSDLPASRQTASLIINLLLRLDKKLCQGGVDDSDGTVGGFIEQAVSVLLDFAKLDKKCVEEFKKLEDIETCFGWEESLLKTLDEQ